MANCLYPKDSVNIIVLSSLKKIAHLLYSETYSTRVHLTARIVQVTHPNCVVCINAYVQLTSQSELIRRPSELQI